MLFRLCEIVGFPHPDYLAPYLSSSQLLDWQTYSTQYGFRQDIQWGLLTQVTASAWGGKVGLDEVMPYQEDRETDQDEVYHNLASIFPALKLHTGNG